MQWLLELRIQLTLNSQLAVAMMAGMAGHVFKKKKKKVTSFFQGRRSSSPGTHTCHCCPTVRVPKQSHVLQVELALQPLQDTLDSVTAAHT
jgi:hypothetical protein